MKAKRFFFEVARLNRREEQSVLQRVCYTETVVYVRVAFHVLPCFSPLLLLSFSCKRCPIAMPQIVQLLKHAVASDAIQVLDALRCFIVIYSIQSRFASRGNAGRILGGRDVI